MTKTKQAYEFIAYTKDKVMRTDTVLATDEKSARDAAVATLVREGSEIDDLTIEVRPWSRPVAEPFPLTLGAGPSDCVGSFQVNWPPLSSPQGNPSAPTIYYNAALSAGDAL